MRTGGPGATRAIGDGVVWTGCVELAEAHAAAASVASTTPSSRILAEGIGSGAVATSVWIAADTLGYPTGAGHLWQFLNWALGLRAAGCTVTWVEPCEPALAANVDPLRQRLAANGLERLCLFDAGGADAPGGTVSVEEAVDADLLLDMAYGLPGALFERFPRTALLDTDPGMSQTWWARGDIAPRDHDVYLTVGEGIARGRSPVPDLGIRWLYAPPCVALDRWRPAPPIAGPYTTITHWWGDSSFVMPGGEVIENTKRSSFLPYLPVARAAGVEIELAVSADDLEDDARLLRGHGWSVSDPVAEAGTPESYRAYIERSRGEFSCAKPAYVALDTGWISDRSVCYLAVGRPVVLEGTGPCRLLDEARGEGVFRFSSAEQAASALREIEADHARHCAAARELAERSFGAERGATRLLELCLR